MSAQLSLRFEEVPVSCCIPKANYRELARGVGTVTGHALHHETICAFLS